MPPKRKRGEPDTNIDSGSLDKAKETLKSIIGENPDLTNLINYFEKGFPSRLLQLWSYSLEIDNSNTCLEVVYATNNILVKCSRYQPLTQYGNDLIRTIFESHTKVLFKTLYSGRRGYTSAVAKLLETISKYQDGKFTNLIFSNLEMDKKNSITIIMDLKKNHKQFEEDEKRPRSRFIRFICAFMINGSSIIRKDVMEKKHFIRGLFKHLNVDSPKLIQDVLIALDKCILSDTNFLMSTKVKIFNDWVMARLISLYSRSDKITDNVTVAQAVHNFMIKLCVASRYSIRFRDNGWYLPTNKQNDGKGPKIYNRLLLSVLESLRPWNDELQHKLCLNILESAPELVAPFMIHEAASSFDPKLTSYWVSHVLLYSEIISLPIPENVLKSTNMEAPPLPNVAENILPTLLSKSSMIKFIQSESLLVRQFGAQLIILSLRKVLKVFELYNNREWTHAKFQLSEEIFKRLPDLSIFFSSLSSIPESNKLLLFTILTLISLYIRLFPRAVFMGKHQLPANVLSVTNKSEFSGSDIVTLKLVLELQSSLTSGTKWYNKAGNSPYSLGTSLLKLHSSLNSSNPNLGLRNEILNLLNKLFSTTVLLNKKSLVSVINPLVHSLSIFTSNKISNEDQNNKIWKLLDESIARCVRTPFKYIDQFREIQTTKVKDKTKFISPLIVTLIEQWKFVPKDTPFDRVEQWLLFFIRTACICGDSYEIAEILCNEANFKVNLLPDFYFVPTNKWINDIKMPINILEIGSGFEAILFNNLKDLTKRHRFDILSPFELVAAKARIERIIHDDQLSYEQSESALTALFTNIGFSAVNGNSELVGQRSFWNPLLIKDAKANEKQIKCSLLLITILEELNSKIPSKDREFLTDQIQAVCKKTFKSPEIVRSLKHFIVNSLFLFSQEEIENLLSEFIETADPKNLSIIDLAIDILTDLLSKNQNIAPKSILGILKRFPTEGVFKLSNELFEASLLQFQEDDDIKQLTEICLNNLDKKSCCRLICSTLTKYSKAVDNLANNISIVEENLTAMIRIAGSLTETTNDTLNNFIHKATSIALSLISRNEAVESDELLLLFTNSIYLLTPEEFQKCIRYCTQISGLSSISSQVCNFLSASLEKGIVTPDIFENFVKPWLQKVVLWITKRLSEYDNLTETASEIISSFTEVILKCGRKFISLASWSHVNSLLEVTFVNSDWINSKVVINLAKALVTCASKGVLNYSKLFQILLNNNKTPLLQPRSIFNDELRFSIALIILRVYNLDPKLVSSSFAQDELIRYCNGTNNPEDLILYHVLERIESVSMTSWLNNIQSLEIGVFEDENNEISDTVKFINKNKGSATIMLWKRTLDNSLRYFNVEINDLPEGLKNGLKSKPIDWINEADSFYRHISAQNIRGASYNQKFLLMAIANSQLFKIDDDSNTITVDIRGLVENKALEFVMTCLGSQDLNIVEMARRILSGVLSGIESSKYRDRDILRVLIVKVLSMFTREETFNNDSDKKAPLKLTSISAIQFGRMISILTNPGHLLYRRAVKYLLRAPTFFEYDIPMYDHIMKDENADTHDIYYRQIDWLIDGIIFSMKTSQDIQVLVHRGVYESLRTLSLSPYTPNQLRLKLKKLFFKMQEIEGGSGILVTRYAEFAQLDMELARLESEVNKNNDLFVKGREKSDLSEEEIKFQEQSNIAREATRLMMGVDKDRILQWSGESGNSSLLRRYISFV